MRRGLDRKVRLVARQAMPFLVPAHRHLVEWSYANHAGARERLFTRIYRGNVWGDPTSVSGGGSTLAQTAVLRTALPDVLRTLGARSLLDASCGDFQWMREVDLGLERYVGGDIVDDLVRRLQCSHGGPGREFRRIDITEDRLPKVDAILCRDCLVDFSFRQIDAAVRNFRRSGAVHLPATTFTDRDENRDIITGDWRTLNMCAPPFDWPEPVMLIDEGCTQSGSAFADKSLGVWELAALPARSDR